MITRRSRKFDDDAYRDGWLDAHVKHLIAAQFRAMRGSQTQEEFGKSIGASQSVVARYENPSYGSMTINTLLDIAKKRRVGLLVRFVPFSRVMDEANHLEFDDLAPLAYERDMNVRDSQGIADTQNKTERLCGGRDDVSAWSRNNSTISGLIGSINPVSPPKVNEK